MFDFFLIKNHLLINSVLYMITLASTI